MRVFGDRKIIEIRIYIGGFELSSIDINELKEKIARIISIDSEEIKLILIKGAGELVGGHYMGSPPESSICFIDVSSPKKLKEDKRKELAQLLYGEFDGIEQYESRVHLSWINFIAISDKVCF